MLLFLGLFNVLYTSLMVEHLINSIKHLLKVSMSTKCLFRNAFLLITSIMGVVWETDLPLVHFDLVHFSLAWHFSGMHQP